MLAVARSPAAARSNANITCVLRFFGQLTHIYIHVSARLGGPVSVFGKVEQRAGEEELSYKYGVTNESWKVFGSLGPFCNDLP